MKLQIDYIFEDFYAAYRAHWKQHRIRTFLTYGCLAVFVITIAITNFKQRTPPGPGQQTLPIYFVLPIIFLVMGSILPFLIPILNRLLVRNHWRNFPRAEAQIEVEFSETGMALSGAGIQASIQWHVFTHYVESSKVFLLYEGPSFSHYFPKRCFADAVQIDEFRSLLRDRIGETSYRRRPRGFPVDIADRV